MLKRAMDAWEALPDDHPARSKGIKEAIKGKCQMEQPSKRQKTSGGGMSGGFDMWAVAKWHYGDNIADVKPEDPKKPDSWVAVLKTPKGVRKGLDLNAWVKANIGPRARVHRGKTAWEWHWTVPVDNSPAPSAPSTSRKKKKNLAEEITGYHQTDNATAKTIIDSGEFKPGDMGWLGAAIYFARTLEDTDYKAAKKGIIIEVKIDLGRVKKVNFWDSSWTKDRLNSEGYDSIEIDGLKDTDARGAELVVFDPDRVTIVSKRMRGK